MLAYTLTPRATRCQRVKHPVSRVFYCVAMSNYGKENDMTYSVKDWGSDVRNAETRFFPMVADCLEQLNNGNSTDLAKLLCITHGKKSSIITVIEGERLKFATPLKRILNPALEGVEIELENKEEEQKQEPEIKVEETQAPVKEEPKAKEEELEEYSQSVKRRIDKLTRKMREAERREQAAIEYAKTVQQDIKTIESKKKETDTR